MLDFGGPRTVFVAELAEGHYVQVDVRGNVDEDLLVELESYIARARKRIRPRNRATAEAAAEPEMSASRKVTVSLPVSLTNKAEDLTEVVSGGIVNPHHIVEALSELTEVLSHPMVPTNHPLPEDFMAERAEREQQAQDLMSQLVNLLTSGTAPYSENVIRNKVNSLFDTAWWAKEFRG